MDYEEYRKAYFRDPMSEPRYHFHGSFGVTLYFEDFEAAVEYYRQVLGPPAYVEGKGTRGFTAKTPTWRRFDRKEYQRWRFAGYSPTANGFWRG